MQRNDGVLQMLGPGEYNDLLYQFYLDNGGQQGSINDAEATFLIAQGASPCPINDMWFEYLRALGYSGALSDMITEFWSVGTGDIILQDDFSTGISGYGAAEVNLSYESSSFIRGTFTTGTSNKGIFRSNTLVAGSRYAISFDAKGTRIAKFQSIGDNGSVGLIIRHPILSGSWQSYKYIISATQSVCRWYLADGGAIGETLDIDNILIQK